MEPLAQVWVMVQRNVYAPEVNPATRVLGLFASRKIGFGAFTGLLSMVQVPIPPLGWLPVRMAEEQAVCVGPTLAVVKAWPTATVWVCTRLKEQVPFVTLTE